VRIGQGIDVHRVSDDAARALVLGLVTIPDAAGLDGHSDADVATHALCDALLGAANLGDLGRHFPDTDEATAGVSSRELLERTVVLVLAAGFRISSADLTIIAERPRLAPFMKEMSEELTRVVGTVVVETSSGDLGPHGLQGRRRPDVQVGGTGRAAPRCPSRRVDEENESHGRRKDGGPEAPLLGP